MPTPPAIYNEFDARVEVFDKVLNPTILPPTYKLPPIPVPPTTCKAPVVVFDAAVMLVIVVMPAIFAPPPILIFSPIPTPPYTTTAPVLVEVLDAVLENINVLVVVVVNPCGPVAPVAPTAPRGPWPPWIESSRAT